VGEKSAGEDVPHLSDQGTREEDRNPLGPPRSHRQMLPQHDLFERVRRAHQTREQDTPDQPLAREEKVARSWPRRESLRINESVSTSDISVEVWFSKYEGLERAPLLF